MAFLEKCFETEVSKWPDMIRRVPLPPCECRAARTGKSVQNSLNNNNTAVGAGALHLTTIGADNTAVGFNALGANVIGGNNTAVGIAALGNATAGFNIGLGFQAGVNVMTAHGVIAIGSPGGDTNNTCFIGNIRDVQTDVPDAITVVIDSAGQLGTMSSSQRFKHDIKPMEKASESILALKPVTFHYNSDKANKSQFGLIAEEVAKVNPDLVVHDKDGQIYTVRYDQVNAMLLNEFLKEHHQVQDLKSIVAEQQKQIEALTAGLQKVSAQVEASKPSPQVVVNQP